MILNSWFNSPAAPDGAIDAPATAARRAETTPAAAIAFEQITRDFAGHYALDGFSLAIAPGETVCLLGPSGCGKTTLLRIASGIEKPSDGRVLINGTEVAGPGRFLPPEQRSVGLMFQDFALFPHLNVLENVAFGLKALPRDEALRRAAALLARVGLESLASAYPHVLSGGQQQRVALARAVAPRPAVMLMDEPFSGLDVQLRDTMQEETLALLRETHATSLIVTHHPEEAMRLGDRIAVMSQGRLVQVGTARELYLKPADLFVARLFSEINEIRLIASGGAVATPFGPLPAPGIADGAPVILALRERSLTVRPRSIRTASPAATSYLPGHVLHTRFLGDLALVTVAVEGLESPLRVRTATQDALREGLPVEVGMDASRALVFPVAPDAPM